jgi:hypothetical protein
MRIRTLAQCVYSKHSVNLGHRIQFHNTSILATKIRYMDHIISEAIPSLLLFLYCWVFRLATQSVASYSGWFLARGFFYPEDIGDTFLRNVGLIHKSYTGPHPRRRHSS